MLHTLRARITSALSRSLAAAAFTLLLGIVVVASAEAYGPVAHAAARSNAVARSAVCPSTGSVARHRRSLLRHLRTIARLRQRHMTRSTVRRIASQRRQAARDRRVIRAGRSSACAVARGSRSARPAGGPLRIGVSAQTFGWGNDAGKEQDVAVQTGARWLREEFQWNRIEPSAGNFDWAQADTTVGEAAKRGLSVLPTLMDTPSWNGASITTVPSDPSAYADFVAHVAARYGPTGDFWGMHPELPRTPIEYYELWNEPYLQNFSAGGAAPAKYARLVKAATAAGRAASPQAKFLVQADLTWTNDFNSYHEWIDAMYAAVPDLNNYFDAVAIHPYGSSPDEYTPNGDTRWEVRRLEQIRAKFVGHGAADKHLWITELGWSTAPGCRACQSDSQQAAYLTRLATMLRTDYSSYVDAFFLYGWRDEGGDPSNKENWFGIIRRDGSKKPAWDALRSITGVA